jgi:hypothetical protein
MIAAVIDIGMGVLAVGWFVVLTVHAAHHRRKEDS